MIDTSIQPRCRKCGEALGSSYLYSADGFMYHHECFPVSPKDAEITRLSSELAASRELAKKRFLELQRFWDALIKPGPRCRDCADFDGRCQGDGHPCDPTEHALENLAASRERERALERERDELWRAIMGAEPDPGLTHTSFMEMVNLAESARLGAIARGQNPAALVIILRRELREAFGRLRALADANTQGGGDG